MTDDIAVPLMRRVRPCPFCGSSPLIRYRPGERDETKEVWSISCYGGETNAHAWFYAPSRDAILDLWNRRA